jgi:hypothetical protein
LEWINFNIIFQPQGKKENMKNREIIMRRMEKVESGIEKLQFALRQNNWTVVDETIQSMRDNINDAKSFVQQEPLGPNEINTSF